MIYLHFITGITDVHHSKNTFGSCQVSPLNRQIKFDTEGAMFQEQESFGKIKTNKGSTDEVQHSSNSDFHTEFVMRDAFGRQVGITNHM